MLPLLGAIVERVSCPVAALPVPYRTTPEEPTFQALRDPQSDGKPFPTALDPFTCTRYELADFAREADALGVRYLGICCGNAPHLTRSLVEALGRTPPASTYSPDMSKHAYFGDDPSLKDANLEFAAEL
jgi:betaine-homocysteine S-methyltransferase